jgi:hypothetical protein
MNVTLLKALVALVPAGILFAGSALLFLRGRTLGSLLQLLGAGCLVMVVLTHLCEALHLFPWMHWGLEHSVGPYLDLWNAVLGLMLFPIGYLLHALTKRHANVQRSFVQKVMTDAQIAEFVAVLSSSLFTGASVYINLVEHSEDAVRGGNSRY